MLLELPPSLPSENVALCVTASGLALGWWLVQCPRHSACPICASYSTVGAVGCAQGTAWDSDGHISSRWLVPALTSYALAHHAADQQNRSSPPESPAPPAPPPSRPRTGCLGESGLGARSASRLHDPCARGARYRVYNSHDAITSPSGLVNYKGKQAFPSEAFA